jgi:hypothetical protein
MSDFVDAITGALDVLNIWKRELIATLKVPTPIKITSVVTTLPDGCIGSGVDDPSDPETLWECSMAHEAWIHRIVVTSPAAVPASPITVGQIMLMGSTGHILSWTPQPGTDNNVIPAIIEQEGRFSAIHLTPGERLLVVGDQLPPGIQVRFDMQINLVSGLTPDTPIPFVGTSLGKPVTNGS